MTTAPTTPAANLNPSKPAQITWIGRPPIISGRYSTVARFSDDLGWPGGEAWSVVVELVDGEARASFLVPDAPHERLKEGAVFKLFEGRNLSACVLILAEPSI